MAFGVSTWPGICFTWGIPAVCHEFIAFCLARGNGHVVWRAGLRFGASQVWAVPAAWKPS